MEEKKSIYRISDDILAIREELMDNGGELTPELEEQLNMSEQQLCDKADSLNGVMRSCENYSKEIADEIKRLQALKKAADNTVKRIKEDFLLYNMIRLEKTEIQGKFCKFYLKKNPDSIEVDEMAAMVPYNNAINTIINSLPSYINVEVKINKTELKKQFPKDTAVLPTGFRWADTTYSVATNKKSKDTEDVNA